MDINSITDKKGNIKLSSLEDTRLEVIKKAMIVKLKGRDGNNTWKYDYQQLQKELYDIDCLFGLYEEHGNILNRRVVNDIGYVTRKEKEDAVINEWIEANSDVREGYYYVRFNITVSLLNKGYKNLIYYGVVYAKTNYEAYLNALQEAEYRYNITRKDMPNLAEIRFIS